jgi:integrase
VRLGKGPRDRYALVDPDSLALVRQMQADQPPSARLFPVARQTVVNIMKDAAQRTGLQAKYEALGCRLSPHALRHAFATHCYERGMEFGHIAKLLGHTCLDDTLLYVHRSLEMQSKMYAASQDSRAISR